MRVIFAEDLLSVSHDQTGEIKKESKSEKTYHKQFSLDIPCPVQTIITLPSSKRVTMNIRRKVTNRRLHPIIQRTPIRQMTPQTHPRRAHAAITRRQRQEIINRE